MKVICKHKMKVFFIKEETWQICIAIRKKRKKKIRNNINNNNNNNKKK